MVLRNINQKCKIIVIALSSQQIFGYHECLMTRRINKTIKENSNFFYINFIFNL